MAEPSKKSAKSSSTRIYCFLAQEAPVAVILRRGPSKQVCLIKWDLKTDKLEVGQWLKGRIYERRCDISPDGELFLYFAANYRPPYYSWTALCKPPYLTAITLWPKGDGWGGGGLFVGNSEIQLNHRPGEDVIAPDFENRLRVTLFGQHPGWGEDSPINDAIMAKNGWHIVEAGDGIFEKRERRWVFKNPSISAKVSNNGKHQLREIIRAIGNNNDAWYWVDYDVLQDGELVLDLSHTDWADWDHTGDLLFARNGKLFRIDRKNISRAADEPALIKEIADLSGLKFEAKPPLKPKLGKYAAKKQERKKRERK